MNRKFTPSPWVNNEQGFLIGKNGNPVKVTDLGALQSFSNCDEHKANSELMRCAPDMYEMLEQSMKMLENFHRNTGSLGAKAKAEEIESLLKRARGE